MYGGAHMLGIARGAFDNPFRPDVQCPFALTALVVQDGQPLPQWLCCHNQRSALFAPLNVKAMSFDV